MTLSLQCTSEQRKQLIEDKKNTNKIAREVQGHVFDGEEILDPNNNN
jgi:hypothetical protein